MNLQKFLKGWLREPGLNISSSVLKAVMSSFSERDETAEVCRGKNGKPEPDGTLRDNENVPLKEDIEEYFKREVLPHVPDAWIDHKKTKVGYEINFTKYFYKYKPLRNLADIRADILSIEKETEGFTAGGC